MKIKNCQVTYVPEKLKNLLGFKGGYLSELWQVVTKIELEDGSFGIGLGVQSVLWSDSQVFTSNSEYQGNEYMLSLTKFAANKLIGKEFSNPIELIDSVFLEAYKYAITLTNVKEKIRETFVKNALVSIDNALWQLYGKIKKEFNLEKLIPEKYQHLFKTKQKVLYNVPLISYGTSLDEIRNILDLGTPLLKIKIGDDNGGKIDKFEMIKRDENRVKEIYNVAKNYHTPLTKSQEILFYLDANGRYENKEQLLEFLSYLRQENILDRVILLEEPFDEYADIDVKDLPVRIVADESVHSYKNVALKAKQGYQAIALKPIAKTLSETLKILLEAEKYHMICFCADLTVNPLMVEWNKNVASRIEKLPEMNVGILESNGAQNYLSWDLLATYHPLYNKEKFELEKNKFNFDDQYYKCSGGIFMDSKYYQDLFNQHLLISFLGDSITERYHSSTYEKSFVPLVGSKLGCRVLNYGISGTRIARQQTPSLDPRQDIYFASRIKDMDKTADYIFVFGGTNDYGHGDAPIGKMGDKTPDTFYGAVDDLINQLLKYFKKEQIIFILPIYRDFEDSPYGSQWNKKKIPSLPLDGYRKIMKEVLNHYHIQILDLSNSFTKENSSDLLFDGLHPNDKGHEVIANKIVEYIKKMEGI